MKTLRILLILLAGCACASLRAQDTWHSADRSWFADAPGCAPRLLDDFIDDTSWSGRRLLPRDCRLLEDRAPLFSWTEPADRNPAEPWTLTIRNAGGTTVATRQTRTPRFMHDQALAPGAYSWTVRYVTRKGEARTSSARRFAIAATARDGVVPTADTIVQRVAAKARPRLAPAGFTLDAIGDAVRQDEYAPAYAMLIKTADEALAAPVPASPDTRQRALLADGVTTTTESLQLRADTGKEGMRLEALGYAWHFTDDRRYRDAAIARLRSMAAWSPTGSTSEQAQDQANRNIYVALATGVDLLWSALTDADRRAIGEAMRARIGPVVAQFGRLDANPYDAHLQTAIGHATTALALGVGVPGFPEAREWLARAWELHVTQNFAWGEEDGGMGNGTTYSWYGLLNLARSFAELRVITGVDFLQRAYARRLGDFVMASTPVPQKATAPFGDETETDYLFQAYSGDTFRLYALLSRQPQHAWYWRQNTAALKPTRYVSAIHFVAEAAAGKPVAPVAPTGVNKVFEDAGLAAFHSDPTSTRRSSLYFRSSRFGSFNHSHADQNAFVLHSGGVALLVGGGYYPYYGSPHHNNIGRATRYKNALTFDGGIGQAEPVARPVAPGAPRHSMDTRGALLAAGGNADIAVATGDATLAYRGWDATARRWMPLLSDATRSVAYLRREKVALVYDHASSDAARRWELNYHAFEPFAVQDRGVVRVENGAASACISHHGPAGSFTQRSGFEIAPEQPRPQQYHGRYTVSSPSTELAVVTVIREGCRDVPVSVSFAGPEATVRVGSHTLRFSEARAQWRD